MSKRKVLWIDCETTGLDPNQHAIIQLAALIDLDGEIIDEFDIFIKPFKGDRVSPAALEKNKTTIEELRHEPKFIDAHIALDKFEEWLSNHVDKFNKTDKLIIAGKNVKFDVGFIRRWFEKCENNFYGSWFFYPVIDLDNELAEILINNSDINFTNFKLENVAKILGVELNNAHNAMGDIKATRECWNILRGI